MLYFRPQTDADEQPFHSGVSRYFVRDRVPSLTGEFGIMAPIIRPEDHNDELYLRVDIYNKPRANPKLHLPQSHEYSPRDRQSCGRHGAHNSQDHRPLNL